MFTGKLNAKVTNIIVMLIFFFIVSNVSAQNKIMVSNQELTKEIDQIMKPYGTVNSPGAAVMVIKDKQIVFLKGYGLADIAQSKAITSDTLFDLASVSKQFTAMAILILVERGKLKLDEPIKRYLPEFPAYADKITIRHLLQHSSGITDYPQLFIANGKIDAAWQHDLAIAKYQPTNKAVVTLLAAQQAPEFSAGEKYSYSNANYILLAEIVGRVAQKTFAQFLKENIFQPLGMSSTIVYDENRPAIDNMATRYDRGAEGFKVVRDLPFDLTYGDHNVYSSLSDLYKWDQALYREDLIKASLLKEIFIPGKLNNGSAGDYGFGWVIDNYFGLPMFYHQGGGEAFNTFAMRIPSAHYTVIVLSNFHRFDPFLTSRRISRLVLADRLKLPIAVKIDSNLLKQYAGLYQLTPRFTIKITAATDHLIGQATGQPEMILQPLSENKFFVSGMEDFIVTFEKDSAGKVIGLSLLQVDLLLKGKRVE